VTLDYRHIRNFRQRITSKHTINANELGTCTSGIMLNHNRPMYYMWSKSAEFIGNKHTHLSHWHQGYPFIRRNFIHRLNSARTEC